MLGGLALAGFASLLLSAAPSADAKLCMATGDDDVEGCEKGDDLLFTPPSWGSEQYPLRIAAWYCDLSRPVALTNGGVVCTYSGPKEGYKGSEGLERRKYAALYNSVKADPNGWTRMDNGRYWRVTEKASDGIPFKEGDKVVFDEITCAHSADGSEELQEPFENTVDAINSKYYLWQSGARYGDTVEIVGRDAHAFLKVKMPAPKKN